MKSQSRSMTITLEEINDNIVSLKKEVNDLKTLLEESKRDLSKETKEQLKEARKTPDSDYKDLE